MRQWLTCDPYGVIYFQSLDGNLYALDEHATSADTALLARIQTGGTWSGPAISHGHVYEGTGDALRYFFVDPSLFSSGSIICLGLPPKGYDADVADRLAKASPLTAVRLTGGPAGAAPDRSTAADFLATALAPLSPAPTVPSLPTAMTPAIVAAPTSLLEANYPVVPPHARLSGTPTSPPPGRREPRTDW